MPASKWQDLPTKAINPASVAMDRAATTELIELMLAEDRKVVAAVQKEKTRIAMGADLMTEGLQRGGRIVFVGAGTSGRLGVIEAAEMLPTFGTPARLVQAIMAGGRSAFFEAKEGVEDNFEEGARALARLRPTKKDVLIGVSASGMTQFVRGALARARRTGVKIIFVTCWPGTELQDLRRRRHRARGRPGDHRGVDAAQGGHRDQAGPEHADDDRDGSRGQDLRESDGRCEDRFREGA